MVVKNRYHLFPWARFRTKQKRRTWNRSRLMQIGALAARAFRCNTHRKGWGSFLEAMLCWWMKLFIIILPRCEPAACAVLALLAVCPVSTIWSTRFLGNCAGLLRSGFQLIGRDLWQADCALKRQFSAMVRALSRHRPELSSGYRYWNIVGSLR